jgi:hypothetical protein
MLSSGRTYFQLKNLGKDEGGQLGWDESLSSASVSQNYHLVSSSKVKRKGNTVKKKSQDQNCSRSVW